ncbi:MAG: aspartate aminotransferase family protein [Desulfarculus sp.]|nr:aspartate aminotransferase family protein [Pseudomonadota bacterium]MBV1715570.1 aspartate aminotransferase family protein [Desulfarculus sp.]MBU4574168.1 aspartate aminotransferase family protein [Pseudomonadota bacterium]MBU4598299.1 aspartate aminotransferase family protein [Pseudomonadota bacterium]MBV1739090.1 aspartate aminotransferase family protein [Desulfarculus sp.]
MPGRKSSVFSRRLDPPLPVAVSGEGVWIVDADGKRYLDASGGAVVVNLGHGRKEIAQAVGEQLGRLYYAHPTMFTCQPAEDLAAALAAHTPGDLNRVYFMTSGSEANETAIKLAHQIHQAQGRPEKTILISRWRSYHGLTMGALAAAGRPAFRVPYMSMLHDAVHIPPPYCLRCSYGLKQPGCGLRCALALDETIQNLGAQVVSAFLIEPVSGATLASYPPPEGYLALVREICSHHGVLLIFDEVMTGMGRTGSWFAGGRYGVTADMMTMGKGLTGGSLPLSAVAVREPLYQDLKSGLGAFSHGGTYSHHPVGCAAGLAAVRILEDEALVERADRMGQFLGGKLHEHLDDSPFVGDVRGVGMLWGVEFVADKKTLAPFPRSEKVTERLWSHLFDEGIIVYKAVGLAGTHGDALVVSPPFIIEEEQILRVAQAIKKAVVEVLG